MLIKKSIMEETKETTQIDVPVETTKPVKFGFNQINNPTPKWAKVVFRVFFYVTGLSTIILDIFTEIPLATKLLILGIVVKSNMLVHAVSKLFGVDISEYEKPK